MIKLDLDLIYVKNNYDMGINDFIDKCVDSSVLEVMEEEAGNGNCQAANFEKNVLNDVSELIEAFKLSDGVNRFLILSNLNSNDLQFFLQKMKGEDLAIGLKFFSKEKILTLLQSIPQEELFMMLKSIYSVEEIVKLIPEKELDNFFNSDQLEPEQLMQYIQRLPEKALMQMMEGINGESCKTNKKESLMGDLSSCDSQQIRDGLTSMNRLYKIELVQKMLKSDESFAKKLSPEALVAPLDQLQKGDIVSAVGESIDPKNIIKLVNELPQDLLAMVATQLDTKQFSDILITHFKDVLSEISF